MREWRSLVWWLVFLLDAMQGSDCLSSFPLPRRVAGLWTARFPGRSAGSHGSLESTLVASWGLFAPHLRQAGHRWWHPYYPLPTALHAAADAATFALDAGGSVLSFAGSSLVPAGRSCSVGTASLYSFVSFGSLNCPSSDRWQMMPFEALETKKQDEPTNPNALRLPLSRASVNESCQRLRHKLLPMSLVSDSCQRPESATF